MVVATRSSFTAVVAVEIAAGTSLASGAVAIAAGTVTTRCAFALNITFRFGLKGTHRQAVFAGFLVYFNEFHFNGVSLLDAGSRHVVKTVPGDFRYVEESVAVWHELNECAELKDRAHLAGVNLALFGEFYNGVNHVESLVDGCFV